VRIRGVGTVPEEWRGQAETVEMIESAVGRCMAGSALSLADVGVLIFSGVYRTDFIYEPAMASMIAGVLDFKSDVESADGRKTLAFDICNGGLGFLNACHAAAQMIHGEQCDAALVVASEVENNTAGCPEPPRGVAEAASAVLLSRTGPDAEGVNRGFGGFLFRYYDEYLDDFQAYCAQQSGASFVRIETNGRLEEHYLECIPRTVEELLTLEGLEVSRVRWIVPPQRSSDFIGRLSQRMNVGKEKFVDVARPGKDLLTSSLGYALAHILEHGMAGPGDIAVLIDVGAGIQVGCAIYYF
jgi:3-oxoacyl-[acyl-carrier-protein] synthase III